jgi:hypothetical protein
LLQGVSNRFAQSPDDAPYVLKLALQALAPSLSTCALGHGDGF